jgi:hypothetical protein
MRYVVAPTSWSPDEQNPFSADGSYTNLWSCFSLKGGPGGGFFTGRTKSGCWLAKFSTGVTDVGQRFLDYTQYENHHGRTVIFDVPEDIDPNVFIEQAKVAAIDAIHWRQSDPEYVVHSTTIDSWNRIRNDNELRSVNLTASRSRPSTTSKNEVEEYVSKEPPEYGDYIMFGTAGSTPELILASYAAGRFVLDEDVPYSPGVRIYVNNREIVTEGFCTRDGIHTTKVYQRLALQRYLILAITVADLPGSSDVETWTPRKYSEQADILFQKHILARKSA